jgi:exo-beta-1,3-glucanase (GH17 family)/cellulose synthase/poly-beta-1,6-N-acetylglucosamine synthase-like glycosyltransferase
MTLGRLVWVVATVAASVGFWQAANRPLTDQPLWSGEIAGFAYSPMRPGQSPSRNEFPTREEMAADLALIAEHSHSIRTYSLDGPLAAIPALAGELGLDVTVGVWLDEDKTANQRRLAELKRTLAEHSNIKRVILGNETVLTRRLTVDEITTYLATIRDEISVPVSTAEPWHIWLEHPELAASADFIAVHILPYWEGVPAASAVALAEQRMSELGAAFPGMPIVVGEIGWPSKGRARGGANASYADAEVFLRHFLTDAAALGYDYFLMEAFDQPWKRADEGEVGAYWGIFDGERNAKYAFDETLVEIPAWRSLASLAAALAAAGFLILTIGAQKLRWPGLALLAAASTAVANTAVWSLHDYLNQYWTFTSAVAALIMLSGILGMVLMILIEAHEWAEADFALRDRARDMRRRAEPTSWPKVSIHVPCYDEPPAMVCETLDAAAKLEYPNFEVIVVDNNTRSEARWRPIEACCQRLGARFRFYHVDALAGFKAGALNFALERTAPDADIIGVIDSDYRVDPHWLAQLVPHFDERNVALVQAPQDYRDHGSRLFKRLCEAEYRGFFRIGMVTRNERNAIIQHGTMTLIRGDVLREVGGWAEWTVTEDAELGLRILAHGHEAVYTTESLGRGLTPDRFRDYRSQRFRWALGAVQILRHHGAKLLGFERSRLTLGQRFHFLTGWTAWLGDGLNLLFNVIAVAWSGLMAVAPLEFHAPVASFTNFVLALFAFKLVKMTRLYSSQVRAKPLETLGAIVAGLSLVFIVGRAVAAGAAGNDARFVRTPKLADRDNIVGALSCVTSEALLAIALVGSAIAVSVTAPFQSADRTLWTVLLLAFAVPHIAAVSVSVLGALPSRKRASAAYQIDEAVTDAQQS